MKWVIISFIVASVIVIVQSQDIPIKSCPSGEHSVLYCPPMAEPNCQKPCLHKPSLPKPCGVPECFCNTGTMRNTHTGKCVKPEDC